MADKEHVRRILRGVKGWNQWWQMNPGVKPDLSKANLSTKNLSNVYLSGADLPWANLSRTKLSLARLSRANLSAADLSETDLSAADLSKALMLKANLTGAILARANLSGAILAGAKLPNAVLSNAKLPKAFLSDVNLSDADLSGAYLPEADLSRADLSRANLSNAVLYRADLSKAVLTNANLNGAILSLAHLTEANLTEADLSKTRLANADLSGAVLKRANLKGADLRCGLLIETCFTDANLTDCRVFGVSAWGVDLEGANQNDLVITKGEEASITVDNLEMAQFIYLLLNNQKLRHIIDTVTSKVVLILGRFTKQRKPVLDAIRERLRHLDFLPVMFDFAKPANRNFIETVRTLAHLSRFIIADIQAAKSVPQELGDIAPKLKVPVIPIIRTRARPWGMWPDVAEYPWVLEVHKYREVDQLLQDLENELIPRALDKIKEIERKRQK